MTKFEETVFAAVRDVPNGKVVTYGMIAERIGKPGASRAVGNALHKNPDPDGTPCFRVVNANGFPSPAFAFGGRKEQMRRLHEDGIETDENGRVDLLHFLADSFV